MTASSTLTSKNQTTVPKVVIAALGLKPADQLIYEFEAGRIVLRARTGRLADLVNEPPPVPPPKRPPAPAASAAAIGRLLGDEDARSKRQGRKSARVPRR